MGQSSSTFSRRHAGTPSLTVLAYQPYQRYRPVTHVSGGIPGQPVEPDVPGPAPEPADTPPYIRSAILH